MTIGFSTRRRQTAHLVAAAALTLLAGWSGQASAQAYPSKPLKFVVPFSAGSATDAVGRIVAQAMGEALGQSTTVDNKAGANGILGAEAVKGAPGDGYTFLVTTSTTQAANVSLYKKLSYDPVKDFTPIGKIGETGFILMVQADFPAKDMKEFIAYAKKNPAKLSYGSAGNGSAGHLAGEMFKQRAGIFALHIPYRGANPAQLALLAGEVDFNIDNLAAAAPNIRAGKLKALAVTSLDASPSLPGVPPLSATFKGFSIDTWWGLVAPAATPADRLARLNAAFVAALNSPETASRFALLLAEPAPTTAAQFGDMMKAELRTYQGLVQRSGAKVD